MPLTSYDHHTIFEAGLRIYLPAKPGRINFVRSFDFLLTVIFQYNMKMTLHPFRQMMFSHTTSFKWVVQTAVLGFPSLGLLLRHRKDRDLAKRKDK